MSRASAKRAPKADPTEDGLDFEKDGVMGLPTMEDLATPMAQRKTVFELTSRTCRFPIGDSRDNSLFFCGGPPVEGMPYCARHCRIAYRPAQR